jgi:hypothetical protein
MFEEVVMYQHYTRKSVVTKNEMGVFTVSFFLDGRLTHCNSCYNKEEATRLAEGFVYIGSKPTLLNEAA